MSITLDGANKLIVLDTSTSFTSKAIHDACISWACLSGNMQYLLPTLGAGVALLSTGVYTDSIITLVNGWKLKPSGYSADTEVTVTGTFITSDGSARAVAPTTGSPVQWIFNAATAGTIVISGSGVTDQDKIDIATLSKNKIAPLLP